MNKLREFVESASDLVCVIAKHMGLTEGETTKQERDAIGQFFRDAEHIMETSTLEFGPIRVERLYSREGHAYGWRMYGLDRDVRLLD